MVAWEHQSSDQHPLIDIIGAVGDASTTFILQFQLLTRQSICVTRLTPGVKRSAQVRVMYCSRTKIFHVIKSRVSRQNIVTITFTLLLVNISFTGAKINSSFTFILNLIPFGLKPPKTMIAIFVRLISAEARFYSSPKSQIAFSRF